MHRNPAAVIPILIVLSMACGSPEAKTSDLRAFGNEPFWNVTVSVTGGIVYGRMGEEDISFPYGSPAHAQDDSTTRVFGPLRDRTGQHEIEVRISERECQDTMADVVHPMRAQVIVDGEELSGCARSLEVEPPGERP